MSREITARFVVHSVKEWSGIATRQYFLSYLFPNWDESDDEADPVAQLLFEVKLDAIPAEFQFTHKDTDGRAGVLFGEEGIMVEVEGDERPLSTGDVVDMTIKVVGRVEFGGVKP